MEEVVLILFFPQLHLLVVVAGVAHLLQLIILECQVVLVVAVVVAEQVGLETPLLWLRLKEMQEVLEHLPHPITRVVVAAVQVQQVEPHQALLVVAVAQEHQTQLQG
jgi:hypothetical protein